MLKKLVRTIDSQKIGVCTLGVGGVESKHGVVGIDHVAPLALQQQPRAPHDGARSVRGVLKDVSGREHLQETVHLLISCS